MEKKLIKIHIFMIENIIFDFDGVLVDSEILARKAFSKYLIKNGINFTEEEFSKQYSGNKLIEVINKLSLRFNIKNKKYFFNEIMQITYKIYQQELSLVKGVKYFLDTISQKKFIGSNRNKQSIIEGLDIVNIKNYFEEKNIFSYDMVENPKPLPDIYLKLVKDTKINPNNTIILEDSIIGVKAAVAANIKVIGITCGGHWLNRSSQSLLEAGAYFVANTFEEVLNILKKL